MMILKGKARWTETTGMRTATMRLNGVGEQANGKFDCEIKVAIRNGNQFVLAYQAKDKQIFRVTGESDNLAVAVAAAVDEIGAMIAEYSKKAYCSMRGSGYTKPELVVLKGAIWT